MINNNNLPSYKNIYISNKVHKSHQIRYVPMNQRSLKSDLPSFYWTPIAENSCDISWKGIPLQKDPFQIVATQQLIQDLQPKTIIEFGSFKGGSALWLADIQCLSMKNCKIISIDLSNLDPCVTEDSRIEFIQGDSYQIEKIFPQEKLLQLPHPILLIEDAHVNSVGIIDYFHKHLFKAGDYFIIEDTNIDYNNACYEVWKKTMQTDVSFVKLHNLNNKIIELKNWLHDKGDMYLLDTKYLDLYGIQNASKNWDSVIRKMR